MSFIEDFFGICDHDWDDWEDTEILKYQTGKRIFVQCRECKKCKKKKYRKEVITP